VSKPIAVTTPIPDDELLAAELTRLDRKIDATAAERRRVADLYQAGLIELPELHRRSSEVAARLRDQHAKRDTLGAERTALAHGNLLRRRVTDFARQISEVIDHLDRPQKQQQQQKQQKQQQKQQLRLLIEDVHVTGWQVKIRLRVPLDPQTPGPPAPDQNVTHHHQPRGPPYCSWVHLDDAARATVLAVEQMAKGVFNIVDDEPAPASEWLPCLAACAGAKRPMRVPKWLARLLAGEVAVTMMTEGRGFSNAKARRELGWELRYPSWRQGFKDGLA
jgi:hypothetical protein